MHGFMEVVTSLERTSIWSRIPKIMGEKN